MTMRDGAALGADSMAALRAENERLKQEVAELRGQQQRRNELCRSVLEHQAELILQFDAQHRLVYANPTVRALLQRAEAGRPFMELVHPEDRQTVDLLWQELRRSPSLSRMLRVRLDGEYRWLSFSIVGAFSAEGELQSAAWIGRDNTDDVHREQALQESEARLRSLIQSMPDIVCFKDGEGRWLVANDFDVELFQLEGVPYVGRTDAELAEFTPFYRDALLTCMETDEEAWQVGRLSRCDEVIPQPDGTDKVFDVIKLPMFHEDGSRRGLLVLGRDITERRQLEDQLRQTARLEAVGQVAGGVAHDFNNVLTAVLGHASLLEDTLEAGPSRQRASVIRQAAERAADLTKQLVRLARPGMQDVGAVDLCAAVDEVLSLLSRTLGAGVEVEVVRPEYPVWVHGDGVQLHQVLVNLALNARDAMEGTGHLKVVLEQQETEVVLSVEDDGPGVPPAMAGRVFEPFFTTKGDLGTGMGLAVCRRIVHDHRGALEVGESALGGARFELRLPGSTPGRQAASEHAEQTRPHRVVLLDDEPLARKAQAAMLSHLGAEVHTAETTSEARELISLHQPTLLVLDIELGEAMNGVEFLAELRREGLSTPAVLVSGLSGDHALEAVAPVQHFLKPVRLQALRSLLATSPS